MAWRILAVPVCFGLVLAGCLSPGDDGDTPQDVLAGRAPPNWAVGQYWTMEAAIWDVITLVVIDEQEDEWVMGTTDSELAWFHHRDEVSFLGEIRKQDLAGSQAGERVRFLDFPLEEGKNWTTYWGEGERLIEVAEVGLNFTLKGYDDGHLAVVYVYDPAVGWFTDMEYYDEEGEVSYRFRLVDHGTEHTGELARWTTPSQMRVDGDLPPQTASMSVAEGTKDLWVSFRFECEGQTGTYSLDVYPGSAVPVPLPGSGYSESGECEEFDKEFTIDGPEPGAWNLNYQQVFLPEPPAYEIEVTARVLEWFTLDLDEA